MARRLHRASVHGNPSFALISSKIAAALS